MDQIEYILDEFPFDDVWQAMRTVGWKWGYAKGMRDPTFVELRHRAKRLLEQAASESLISIGSGGFEARCDDGVLELRFVLAKASGKYYDNSDMS